MVNNHATFTGVMTTIYAFRRWGLMMGNDRKDVWDTWTRDARCPLLTLKHTWVCLCMALLMESLSLKVNHQDPVVWCF